MSSGPVVPVVLEKENAILDLRDLVGATNPESAASGTIRDVFGKDIQCNSVHASDGEDTAKTETKFFFPEL
jgi:nucleoside-diphosphate kinase